MIKTAHLIKSAPIIGLLIAMLVVVPRMNAAAGPPQSIFVQLDPAWPDPRIEVDVSETEKGEWLIHIKAEGFTFSSLCTAVTSGVPVGHAHIYDGDDKIVTAYEPILSLGQLSHGEHRLRVILRAQDHRALVGSSGLIEQEFLVTVGRA